MEADSEVVLESLNIVNFLDEKYPQNPLYPTDLVARKRDQELITKIDPLIGLFYQCVLSLVQKTPQEWAEAFASGLEELESELATRATTFFRGDKPGMVVLTLFFFCNKETVNVFLD